MIEPEIPPAKMTNAELVGAVEQAREQNAPDDVRLHLLNEVVRRFKAETIAATEGDE